MAHVSLRELLEAGVHFGHQVKRWNPKMAPFIFGARDGIHIVDLAKTQEKLEEAYEFLKEVASQGKVVIFVGTKKQAQDIVKEEASRAGAMYLTERWIGGLLTNWEQIKKNLEKLADLKTKKANGELAKFTKKENVLFDREIAKLERYLGGVADLKGMPGALFVVDSKKEENAVREAIAKEVPVVAICDTNGNPDLIDWPIPGNDDAIKSIRLITKLMADAVGEGRTIWEKGVGGGEVSKATGARSSTPRSLRLEEQQATGEDKKVKKIKKIPVKKVKIEVTVKKKALLRSDESELRKGKVKETKETLLRSDESELRKGKVKGKSKAK